MRIWLDDIRDPKDYNQTNIIWVKTAGDAIGHLLSRQVTFISFDHDLGIDLDGHDVATFIEQMVYEKKIPMPKWNIHSANPVGEAEIAAAMKSAERFAK